MSGNRTNFGYNFEGSIGSIQSPMNFQGGVNNIVLHTSPPGNSATPVPPVPADLSELQSKVEIKLQKLRDEGEEDPLREFFRTRLTQFMEKTSDPERLADHLHQSGVLTEYQRQKVKTENLEYNKNDILYNIVIKKEAIAELLPALKKSGNENILKIINELAN
ncbi:unnamed protein product [Allacma fusca]|uniref:CARD domain-containing protein n=1 Tax=Allacma fusca TaxID=39272 RepID=A0A8J2IYZ9_9HEXA|nr:unnamed protein product [Allacma fusca]